MGPRNGRLWPSSGLDVTLDINLAALGTERLKGYNLTLKLEVVGSAAVTSATTLPRTSRMTSTW